MAVIAAATIVADAEAAAAATAAAPAAARDEKRPDEDSAGGLDDDPRSVLPLLRADSGGSAASASLSASGWSDRSLSSSSGSAAAGGAVTDAPDDGDGDADAADTDSTDWKREWLEGRRWSRGLFSPTVSRTAHSGPVHGLHALPNGQFVTGSDDGSVQLWTYAPPITSAQALPPSAAVNAAATAAASAAPATSPSSAAALKRFCQSAPPLVSCGRAGGSSLSVSFALFLFVDLYARRCRPAADALDSQSVRHALVRVQLRPRIGQNRAFDVGPFRQTDRRR
jgi:hypothetical protein